MRHPFKLLISLLLILSWLAVGCTQTVKHEPVEQPARLTQATDDARGSRLALVIGNDAYRHAPKLQNAVADADAVAGKLRDLGYEVTHGSDLRRREMLDVVNTFADSVANQDEVVFFYAGHSVQVKNGNYLIPIDLRADQENHIVDDGVELSTDLLAKINVGDPRFTLAIVDACRDNPFADNRGRSIGASAGLAPPTNNVEGSMIVYSAGAGQKALDRLDKTDPVSHGLFTRELLNWIDKPGFTINQVFTRVKQSVYEKAQSVGHTQTPAIYDQSVGVFHFLPLDRSAPVLSVKVEPAQAEIYVDGEFRGTGEIRVSDFAVDTIVTVQARLDGYETKSERVRIGSSEGEEQQVDLVLSPKGKRGMISVQSNPAGARWLLDGVEMGQTPESGVLVAPGRYEITVQLDGDGYVPWVKQVVVGTNGSTRLVAELQRAQGTAAPAEAETFTEETTGLVFRLIDAGSFTMGSPPEEKDRDSDEEQHEVTLEAFYISTTEVTRHAYTQFVRVTGYGATQGAGCWIRRGSAWDQQASLDWRGLGFSLAGQQPVTCVTWADAMAFASWLSGKTGHTYRLPSEAEWEYAARAGTQTAYWWGDAMGPQHLACSHDCGTEWVWDAKRMIAPVASLEPNPWGLYDVHGNAWEWTCSQYQSVYAGYELSCQPSGNASRVIRGGGWDYGERRLRAANRLSSSPDKRYYNLGFRLVRVP